MSEPERDIEQELIDSLEDIRAYNAGELALRQTTFTYDESTGEYTRTIAYRKKELNVGQTLTAIFRGIDERFAVGDDYRIELGIWVWPGEVPSIEYWTKLIKIDINDHNNRTVLIDLNDRATDTLEEAVYLLMQEWEKLAEVGSAPE